MLDSSWMAGFFAGLLWGIAITTLLYRKERKFYREYYDANGKN